jgi:hypothetical protein
MGGGLMQLLNYGGSRYLNHQDIARHEEELRIRQKEEERLKEMANIDFCVDRMLDDTPLPYVLK